MTKFKTILAAFALATATAFAAPAMAETYVGVGAGTSITSVEGLDLDDGFAIDLVVGTDVGPVRVEGGIARVNNDTNFLGLPVNVSALEYSAMAFYDIPTGTSVTPYVGAGVTYTDAQADVFFTDIDAQGWGYQLAGGFRTAISDRLTADVGVRYGKSQLDAAFLGDVDVESTRLRVGLSFAL